MFVTDTSSWCKPGFISILFPQPLFSGFFFALGNHNDFQSDKDLLRCFYFYSDADQGKNKLQPSPNPNHRQSNITGSSFTVRYFGTTQQNQEP